MKVYFTCKVYLTCLIDPYNTSIQSYYITFMLQAFQLNYISDSSIQYKQSTKDLEYSCLALVVEGQVIYCVIVYFLPILRVFPCLHYIIFLQRCLIQSPLFFLVSLFLKPTKFAKATKQFPLAGTACFRGLVFLKNL